MAGRLASFFFFMAFPHPGKPCRSFRHNCKQPLPDCTSDKAGTSASVSIRPNPGGGVVSEHSQPPATASRGQSPRRITSQSQAALRSSERVLALKVPRPVRIVYAQSKMTSSKGGDGEILLAPMATRQHEAGSLGSRHVRFGSCRD